MKLSIRDMMQETILLENHWDRLLTQTLNESLKQGDVFIDVGANVGYFSLLAAKRVGETGRVLAIEPNPAVADQLRANVERSKLSNVIVEEVACSEFPDSMTLYIPKSSVQASLSPSNGGTESTEVRCVPLDQLHDLPKVSFIKIDVEGAELIALKGMRETLVKFRPTIVIELVPHHLENMRTSKEEVIKFLTDLNYSVDSMGAHENYICHPNERTLLKDESKGTAF